jgi:ribonucleoside-diphosphate reductase alpha chain
MLDSNIPSNTPPITQTNNQPLTTNLSNLADSGVSNTQTTRTTSPYSVIRRNGQQTPFDLVKITLALTKAFLAVEGQHANSSARIHELVEGISQQVYKALIRRLPESGVMFIEDIQDQVELGLMRAGEQKVARAYVLYRSQREMERQSSLNKNSKTKPKNVSSVKVVSANDESLDIEYAQIQQLINIAAKNVKDVSSKIIFDKVIRSCFDGMKYSDLSGLMVLSARSLIDQEPNYSQVSARLLLNNLAVEAISFINQSTVTMCDIDLSKVYSDYFKDYLKTASKLKLLDEELTQYDLEKLTAAIKPERDQLFNYLGLQTLYDRYFIQSDGVRFELPQAFFMRVAMGLAINEVDRESRAIEFYDCLSSFDFMSSTPTLFNSGTLRSQLSSCYLTTVPDSLYGIYDSLKDNAMLSKFAGGLGNDWTPVRAMGSHIVGTNGASQGVIPFLKVANDTAVAVNQGGKRKGAMCAYLETWHIDVEDFLELRKNTGDERRRTHDMNTANWVPDLFLKRVCEEAQWTLFSPDETPDLHELYGQAFETAYIAYEEKAAKGELKLTKKVNAVELWRKMLGMIFETGHPWITFKDPCNIRYTNQHKGTVHSSNLCTEITLHTNEKEIAVCNLGSINLAQHTKKNGLNKKKLEATIKTAMRMLDNVIDYNYYSVPQARHSNLQHRPVGLGLMGFQDSLYIQNIAYASEQAVDFADQSMELISYHAIKASSDLAKERGAYSSYQGSLWSQGILPIDSAKNLGEQRGNYFDQNLDSHLDWENLRQKILKDGMRNSNCLAIAPTATISNICGVSQSIEPTYQNMYVKSNLSGEFTVVNNHLVDQLKKLKLWDEVMSADLKYFDGSVQSINRIPEELKAIYATAFEIDSRWLIEAGSRRQKWIDQAQSLNLYMAEASGEKLDQLYKLAWVRGLKTTYYLRSLGATQMEKNTQNNRSQGYKSKDNAQHDNFSQDAALQEKATQETIRQENETMLCSILDPDCDACQ